MSKVSALKGVRTRYKNIIEKEIDNADSKLKEDEDKEECVRQARKSLKLINIYKKKLEENQDKLIEAIGESDAVYIEQMFEEDCNLNLQIEGSSIDIEDTIMKIEEDMKTEDTGKENKPDQQQDQMTQLKSQMQNMMVTQMQQQIAFYDMYNKKQNEDSCSVNLPELNLNSFNGNKMKWTEFWDAFESTIHNNKRLSGSEKLLYLMSKLDGEAKRAVKGFALSNTNYDLVIQILKERFGNKQVMIDMHYQELMNIPQATNKVENLRILRDTFETQLRSLEVLGEDTNQGVFVSMYKQKMPAGVLRQLELKKGSLVEWNIERLRQGLNEYVTACEKVGKPTNENGEPTNEQRNKPKFENKYVNNGRKQNGYISQTFVAGASHTYRDKCRYCSESHWSDQCQKYKTTEQRKQRLKGSCFLCLKDGHQTRECTLQKMCVHCGERNKHHRSLCKTRFGMPVSNVHLSDENSDLPVCNYQTPALVSSNEMMLMQPAKTELTNPMNSSKVSTWNTPVFQYRHETANDTFTVLSNEILVMQRETADISKPKTASNSSQGISIPETGVLRNEHHGIEKVNIDNKEDTADLDTRSYTGTTRYNVLRQTETADIQTPKTLASEEVERRTQLSNNRHYVVETEHVDTNMNSEEPVTTGDTQSTVTAICNQRILSHDPDLSTQQMKKWAYRIPAKALPLKDLTNTKSL